MTILNIRSKAGTGMRHGIAGSPARRQRVCALLLAATIPAGLVWRLAPLHLPAFAFKYGGSALWAVAVYWSVALLLPRRVPPLLALVAGTIAVGVECFKNFRFPVLDRFRDTLAGKLLLGRYFTISAILAYLIAIVAVAWLDARLRPGRVLQTPSVDSRLV